MGRSVGRDEVDLRNERVFVCGMYSISPEHGENGRILYGWRYSLRFSVKKIFDMKVRRREMTCYWRMSSPVLRM